jgi:molybdate transport system substrate-binding protein
MMVKKLISLILFCTCLFSSSAWSMDFRIYSAAGVKLPMLQFTAAFNSLNTGDRVVNSFDTAGAAEKFFFEDSNSACLITTESRINEALKTGRLKASAPIALADTVAGIATSGKVKQAIDTSEQLRAVLLNARSIAFSDPARGATVGRYFQSLIEQLGIEKEVMAKAILASDGVETMKLVKAKKVELGVTQLSEIIQAWPESLLGPFPRDIELATRYSLWCKDPVQTKLAPLIALIQSAWGSRVFTDNGLRPVGKP